VPRDLEVKVPLGFAVARGERELAEFLSQWIELKSRSGELDELYEYWILGQIDYGRPPRWSILRDVLGIGGD
jgi:ABC-type amino acid transport substrate-binding protein